MIDGCFLMKLYFGKRLNLGLRLSLRIDECIRWLKNICLTGHLSHLFLTLENKLRKSYTMTHSVQNILNRNYFKNMCSFKLFYAISFPLWMHRKSPSSICKIIPLKSFAFSPLVFEFSFTVHNVFYRYSSKVF